MVNAITIKTSTTIEKETKKMNAVPNSNQPGNHFYKKKTHKPSVCEFELIRIYAFNNNHRLGRTMTMKETKYMN